MRRIRALLAKAESTTFPLEAASLRTKARELMDRYGVTIADLHRPSRTDPLREEPVPADGWGGVWTGGGRNIFEGLIVEAQINGVTTMTTNFGFGNGIRFEMRGNRVQGNR